jgi:hypothetical protein
MAIKKILLILWLISLTLSGLAYAHHAALGIVDEEIYAMIDEMVADTPHADLIFEDLGAGMTAITVETRTPVEMERLIEDGLLTYSGMLDGTVRIEIDFAQNRSVVLTIYQQE